MKILIIFAILTCVNANEFCEKLKSVYKAFECIPRCRMVPSGKLTKYSCLRSPYKLNYSPNTCFFKNRTYQRGQVVDGMYAIPGGGSWGSYFCDGGYFDFNLGDPNNEVEQDCLSSVLYYQAEFANNMAPVYLENAQGTSPCPIRWVERLSLDPNIVYNDAPCSNNASCCQFVDKYVPIGTVREFPNQGTTCICQCPPLMFCSTSQ